MFGIREREEGREKAIFAGDLVDLHLSKCKLLFRVEVLMKTDNNLMLL